MSVRSRLSWTSKRSVRATVVVAVAVGVLFGIVLRMKKGRVEVVDSFAPAIVDDVSVPVPDGVLATIGIANPNASWARLQRGIGGAATILPVSAGGVLCATLGLDSQLASEIDGASPAFGVVAGDAGDPHYLLALRLLDERKTRAHLVDGDTAPFTSRPMGTMTELFARGGTSLPLALGLSPNGYLLMARVSADLDRLGPYVTRTLSRAPPPSDVAVDVPHVSLETLVRSKLEGSWARAKHFLLTEDERMRKEHGGRAPDYGDPTAVVDALDAAIHRRAEAFADLEKVHVAIDIAEDALSAVTTLTPHGGAGPATQWISSMAVGDTVPLTRLPASAAAAVLMRSDEADRADAGGGAERFITEVLGRRLSVDASTKLRAAIENEVKARSDVLTAALLWDEPQGIVLQVSLRDAEAATKSVHGVVELARVEPFRGLLHAHEVTTGSEDVAGIGHVSTAMMKRDARTKGGREPHVGDKVGLAWVVEDGTLAVAAGDAPTASLRAVRRPERTLSDDPWLQRVLGASGSEASSVLVLQPLRFDPMRANLPAAPVVVMLGRKKGDAVLRLDVPYGLLQDLARHPLGL